MSIGYDMHEDVCGVQNVHAYTDVVFDSSLAEEIAMVGLTRVVVSTVLKLGLVVGRMVVEFEEVSRVGVVAQVVGIVVEVLV